ncbi:MAG: sugar ABC transporter ATP-binding protein [Verrucomicrobiota bacterium]
MTPVLQLNGIVKRFGGFAALRGVDLEVRAGEIHALMGENGAGKSTLIKVMTGVHAPDEGTIRLGGLGISPQSPREAEAAGISTVYQEVNLLPNLSVAENILLGRQPMLGPFIRHGEVKRRARAALQRLGLDIDVTRTLGEFPVAVRQMAAIARALDVRAKVLILDEPTSSLDAKEVDELLTVMRGLRDGGMGIVFVSHFLDQIYSATDRITVLRDGGYIGTWDTASLPRLDLIGQMLGKPVVTVTGETVAEAHHSPPPATGIPLLSLQNLAREKSAGPLNFDIAPGSLTGLAGLLGSGRTESARMLFGIDPATSGKITLAGKPARLRTPREAVRHGLAFCSEDRKAEGLFPDLSVRENIVLALQASRGALRRISRKEQDALAEQFIASLNIKTRGPETPAGLLSGGNQQKVLLARWLALQPKLLILDEPTRGIDIGAKGEIETLLRSLRDKGLAVVFISAELEEVVRLCDQVVVLRDRHQEAVLQGPAISMDAILRVVAAAA